MLVATIAATAAQRDIAPDFANESNGNRPQCPPVNTNMAAHVSRSRFRDALCWLCLACFTGTATAQNPLLAGATQPNGPAPTANVADAPGTFENRRDEYIATAAAMEPHGTYPALLWLAAKKRPPATAYQADLEKIVARRDCADFCLHGVLRALYQFDKDPNLDAGVRDAMREVVLGFKYWPDEPGLDSMCTWSENHFILFASAGYLAGQRYPDAVFANTGATGRETMARFRPRVEKWLELRFKTGFSEWLSNVYYDEDLTALVNLVDFCADEALATRAAMVLDLLLADIACNSFQGLPGSTQGRTYARQKKWPTTTSISSVARLAFGRGAPGGSMGATQLALSTRYRVPAVLVAIAANVDATVLNRQRMGIRIDEGARWGLGYNDAESGMHWLTLEAYTHPRTINLFTDMLETFHWDNNSFFSAFKANGALLGLARGTGMLPVLSYAFLQDVTRNMRPEVDIYTYRTPDYQLSTAQDWRPGFGGDQQHLWQATLGPAAVCFTTHPTRDFGGTPDHWAGNGTQPRAAQVENVAICIYDINTRPGLYITNRETYTHAWLPVDGFDEVVECPPWIFARKDNGYLALFSQHPWHWQEDRAAGEDFGRELIVAGTKNIYICELGRAEDDGSFDTFIERIGTAAIETRGLRVRYASPTQGLLEFDATGPLTQDGTAIDLHGYPRYANPYAQAEFPGKIIRFDHGTAWLALDWEAGTRHQSTAGESAARTTR